MRKALSQEFFNRPILTVARELLGKFLVRRFGRKEIAVMVAEVEVYDGPYDKASHASRGLTPRTEVMFGEAGRFYVYFIYGIHWLLNVVTGPKGYPAAVLVRAGVLAGTSDKGHATRIINGPAKLAKYMRITKAFNNKPAARKTGLWFEDRGAKIRKKSIIAGTRIGVEYAGAWAKKLYNFRIRRSML